MRAFPVALLPTLLEVQGDRYEYELRVLLHSAKFRQPVTQISIETIYEAGNPTSHFRPLQDSARIWAPLLKFAASSGVATVIDYVLVLLLNSLTGALFFPVVAARLVSASEFRNEPPRFRGHGSAVASQFPPLCCTCRRSGRRVVHNACCIDGNRDATADREDHC